MSDYRRGTSVPGLAVIGGMLTGLVSVIIAVFALFDSDWIGTGVCLAAAGLSFGLIANAAFRH